MTVDHHKDISSNDEMIDEMILRFLKENITWINFNKMLSVNNFELTYTML